MNKDVLHMLIDIITDHEAEFGSVEINIHLNSWPAQHIQLHICDTNYFGSGSRMPFIIDYDSANGLISIYESLKLDSTDDILLADPDFEKKFVEQLKSRLDANRAFNAYKSIIYTPWNNSTNDTSINTTTTVTPLWYTTTDTTTYIRADL